MSKRTSGETHPFKALEEEAYHAFREWHLWLVLRERELQERLAPGGSPPLAGRTGQKTEQLPRDSDVVRE